MNTIFFGSSKFSSNILRTLSSKGIKFPLVITKSPKIKGRGRKKKSTPVGKTAKELSLNLIETDNPNTDYVINTIRNTGSNSFLLASYGAILKAELLSLVEYPVNIHPSLLPKYRGASPIRRVLMNREDKTGVTIFIMNEEMDTGDIIFKESTTIMEDEVATELENRLSDMAADMVVKVLNLIQDKKPLPLVQQNDREATYASRIEKKELRINWETDATKIIGKIRGLATKPGAYTYFRGKRMKILRAREVDKDYKNTSPGKVIAINNGLIVSAKNGAVEINQVQIPGRKVIDAISLINGYHIKPGEIWSK